MKSNRLTQVTNSIQLGSSLRMGASFLQRRPTSCGSSKLKAPEGLATTAAADHEQGDRSF